MTRSNAIGGVLLFIAVASFFAVACSEGEQIATVECRSNSDCPLGQRCQNFICTGDGVPVDGDGSSIGDGDAEWTGECRVDDDCDEDYVCEDGFCMPAGIGDGDEPDGDTPDGDGTDGDQSDGDEPDGDDINEKPCRNHAECNDGIYCNGTERCGQDNYCIAGTPPCDDNIECTDNLCDETANECNYEPNHQRCSDHEPCNGEEICDPQVGCQAGSPPNCDDGHDCTTDSCETGSGCLHLPNDAMCNDGVDCTADTCNPEQGCQNTPKHDLCADDIDCTSETCDPVQGCLITPVDQQCEDSYSCTVDTCTLAEGCQNIANHTACPENWLCDPNAPGVDTDTGCAPTPECANDEECDDARWCNGAETCVNYQCVPGTAPDCDDGIGCTEDVCDEDNNTCVNTAINARCRDDNVCNGMETCDPVQDCQLGEPLNCDDEIDCTTDACDTSLGCQHTPNNDICNDGVDCTADLCHLTQGCKNTPEHSACDDLVPCTADVCDPVTGCSSTPDDDYCDDGFDCTTETCTLQFSCVYVTDDSACNDGITCTHDACVELVGCTNTADNDLCVDPMLCDAQSGCVDPECTGNADCDDADYCTGQETCVNYTCQQGAPPNCYAESGGLHFDAWCSGSCQFACQTNWFDCNGDLGTPAGNGCETQIKTLALDVAYEGNTCTDGFSRMDEYGGECPGFDNGWYEEGPEVIYKWTAPSSVDDDIVLSAESDSSGVDPDVWVLTDPCNPASCIMYEGYDDGNGLYYAQFTPTPNQTYYFVVDSYTDNGYTCGHYRMGANWLGSVDCEQSGPAHRVTFVLVIGLLAVWSVVVLRRRRKQ